jgi:FtsH-binding integral membrane protein
MMGVLGLIIAGIVNMFLHNSMMNTIISFLGVVMFTGLTAYDVQKIKQLGYALAQKGEDENKIALLGALTLYLDFVNLFMYLLSLLGKRKK